MPNTLYTVVERFKNKDAAAAYRRFRDRGRMAPWSDLVGCASRTLKRSAFRHCASNLCELLLLTPPGQTALGNSVENGGNIMKRHFWIGVCVATMVTAGGGVASAQRDQGESRNTQNRDEHSQFDDHDKQVTRDWYNQHRDHAPSGFRDKDRLSADEESRLRPGAQLDPDLRRKEHGVPRDLGRQLPPPPRNHKYVAIGLHVALVDNGNHVKDVIHVHQQ